MTPITSQQLRQDLAGLSAILEIHRVLPFYIWTITEVIREYNVGVVNVLFLILATLQAAQPPASARGDRFQIPVPNGWRVLTAGTDVVLEHSTGASLLLLRATATANLEDFAQRQAERIMTPLGFAKLGEPQHFKAANQEWVQYEIRGNRLSEHRRILYRAFRRGSSLFELVYENSEDRFDLLLTEAGEIATSLQVIIETPPARRRVRR
jgi:hypothetical protein